MEVDQLLLNLSLNLEQGFLNSGPWGPLSWEFSSKLTCL